VPQIAITMNKRAEAARLRAQGLTLEAIGKPLGISRQGVHQLLRNSLLCGECGREISRRYSRLPLTVCPGMFAR
jgi:hypothetical protein